AAHSITSWFRGPMMSLPSFARLNSSFGEEALAANKFTTWRASYRSRLAKPTHRRIVGSSFSASAVEGLSITNRHVLGSPIGFPAPSFTPNHRHLAPDV